MTDLQQRVFAAIAAEPSPARPAVSRMRTELLAGAILVSLSVFIATGGIRPTGRPAILMIATFAGAIAISAGAALLALRRGRSMLGRSAPVLVAIALATPLLLLAWKISVSALFSGMSEPWPDRVGLRCLSVALLTGAAPFAAFVQLWRHTQPAHPRLTGLALGTAAGGMTWVLVDLWCPVAYFEHLLLGHVLPIAVFAALGAAAGSLLAARTR